MMEKMNPATELDPVERTRLEEIEEAARHSWPAPHTREMGGWWLRAGRGITGRANSVWAVRTLGATPLDARLAQVEEFYAAHDLPSRFQMTPAAPAALDPELERRGFRADSWTWVQTTPLGRILRRTPGLSSVPHIETEVAEKFDDEWFALYCEAEDASGPAAEVREAILRRIDAPVAFVAARVNGEPAAVGLGVVHGLWLGVFCMSTRPAVRRMGAATAILRTLSIWASLYNAEEAYLQVKQNNAAALATYARAGFQSAYPYYYRIKG